MDQVDDVREYLPDEASNLFFIRRLLTWLKPFQRDLQEKKPDIDVSQGVFVSQHSLFLFSLRVLLSLSTIVTGCSDATGVRQRFDCIDGTRSCGSVGAPWVATFCGKLQENECARVLLCCIVSKCTRTNDCIHGQVTGNDLQGMDLQEVRGISPNRTQAECKLLVQRIKDVQAVSQVLGEALNVILYMQIL